MVERRIRLLFVIFAAGLALAGLRALQLATVGNDKLAQAANTQQNAVDTLPARRGTITDRHGEVLAVSTPAEDVSITPYLITNPTRTAATVAQALDLPEPNVYRKMSTTRDGEGKLVGFAYIARGIDARKTVALQKQLKKLQLPGVAFTPTMRRDYPHTWMGTQVIGVVNQDGKGLFGLEYSRNRVLRGHDGVRETTRDAKGESVEVRDAKTTKSGRDLRLTLDASIQEKTEAALRKVGKDFQPKSATAIVMDPQTGALVAVANWPQVDATHFGQAPEEAIANQATGFNFEPGSTFKAFTVAGALEEGDVTPDTSFNLAPTIQVADREIGEAHERGWETMTTGQILAQSSNVGAITIGQRLGKKRFDGWVRRFGFGKQTGVDLPGDAPGMVIKPSQYSGSSMGNLPIGQGLLVTPMQMATAYAAIANGGILRPPHVIEAVGGRETREPKGRRVISERTASQLRIMLEGVLAPGGTASEVNVDGYVLAGKTGTANKIDPATRAYSKEKYVSSFVGFAPAANPRLLVSVVVDEPKGDIYGGSVAAPAFKEIADFALPRLGISPTD